MRISNKLIDEVVREVAGEDVVPLVDLIKKKKNISEFKIAEVMDINVNVVRNMLYRLYHKNLVSFVRKKDKKKGWYIYYWTFNMKRVASLINEIRKDRIEKLQERLDREKNSFFFVCPESCMRLDFEKATDYGFRCPECGSLMSQEDNSEKIKQIEKELKELEEATKKAAPKKKNVKKKTTKKTVKKKNTVKKTPVKKGTVKKKTTKKTVKKKTVKSNASATKKKKKTVKKKVSKK